MSPLETLHPYHVFSRVPGVDEVGIWPTARGVGSHDKGVERDPAPTAGVQKQPPFARPFAKGHRLDRQVRVISDVAQTIYSEAVTFTGSILHPAYLVIAEEGQSLHAAPQSFLRFVRGASHILRVGRSAIVLVVVLRPYQFDHVSAEALLLRADLQPLDCAGERDVPVPGEHFRATLDDLSPVSGRDPTRPQAFEIQARRRPVSCPQQRQGDGCQKRQEVLGEAQLLPVEIPGIRGARQRPEAVGQRVRVRGGDSPLQLVSGLDEGGDAGHQVVLEQDVRSGEPFPRCLDP